MHIDHSAVHALYCPAQQNSAIASSTFELSELLLRHDKHRESICVEHDVMTMLTKLKNLQYREPYMGISKVTFMNRHVVGVQALCRTPRKEIFYVVTLYRGSKPLRPQTLTLGN